MNFDNFRNWLNASASELRSRKVLAAVALLIAVAVAIPLLLSHSGTPASLAALPAAPTTTTPVAAPASAQDTSEHHAATPSPLKGRGHNPFIAATTTAAAATAAAGTTTAHAATTAPSGSAQTSTTSTSSGAQSVSASPAASVSGGQRGSASSQARTGSTGSVGSGGSPGTTTTPTVVHTVTTPAVVNTVTVVKTVTKPAPYSDYQADISLRRHGTTSTVRILNHLARYQLLPSDDGAFATFLGVRPDAKTAVFVLGSGVTVSGAGRCAPSATDCTFLTLEPGQSTTLSAPAWAGGFTYTLNYMSVHKLTSSASVTSVDASGLSVVRKASGEIAALKNRAYAHYTGLLSIALGATVPVAN